MAPRIVRFESTPNPNALKCVADRALSETPRSYRAPPDPETDPLGAEVFALPGVVNLLILHDWLTVNRAPEADWKPIKAGVRRAVRRLA